MMKQFDLRRQQQLAWLLLLLVIFVYAVEMSHQTLLRYDTFKATAFDLGNMDQVLWNTLHGRLFQFTNQAVDWYGPPTRLAIHFEPIILPLSLLYIFHADPRILLVFQTLALVSGALPIFLLARKYLAEWPLLAPLMVMAYLLSPTLLGLNIFDFHPVSLATPLLLYAMLALTYKRYGWFLLACVLASACKEDVPLAIAMLGFLLLWKYKLPRLGLTLIIGGFLWSLIAFKFIIPHFYPGVQANNFWYRYEALGSSPGAAIVNLTLHPWLVFTTLITLNRLYYLASLFRSVGFMSLLAPEWLLPALPSLAVNLLSTDDPLIYSGVYHYNATIIPFVILSAIHGTRRLITIWQSWRGEKTTIWELQDNNFSFGGFLLMLDGWRWGGGGEDAGRGPWWPPVDWGVPSEDNTRGTAGGHKGPLPTQPPLPPLREPDGGQKNPPLRIYERWAGINPALAFKQFSLQLLQWSRQSSLSTRLFLIIKVRSSAVAHIVSIQWKRFSERMVPLASSISVLRLQWVMFAWITLMLGLNFLVASPHLNPFWADHEAGSREQHIQQLLAMIPPNASVSAGDNLNPHLSERQRLAVFPSITDSVHHDTVQYIIVDLNDVFPENRVNTTNELHQLVSSGQYKELGRAEGVVLLVRLRTK